MHIYYCVPQRWWVGGGTLSEKLLLRFHDGLKGLERLKYTIAAAAVIASVDLELSFTVKKDITHIQSLCVEIDRL
ncbi:hypothetical protein CR513_36766, partial [Mucuna pruriens]